MVRKDFETYLGVGDVRIGERDVEMLRAIDRCGSMHRAAAELGRSYAHLQRRVDEIETAAGAITERKRGGADGGGTALTARAVDLLEQFERLRGEFEGVAAVTESVFDGTVLDRTGEVAVVDTAFGEVLAVVPDERTDVRIGVRSDAVVLTLPADAPDGERTSLRNQFRGTVGGIEAGEAVARVAVDLGGVEEPSSDGRARPDDGATLVALITAASFDRMALGRGDEVVASFKATAARGIGSEE